MNVNIIFCIAIAFSGLLHYSEAGTCLDNTWEKYGNTKCYKLIKQLQIWQEAVRACRAFSPQAVVGSIQSSEEQSFLLNYMFTSSGTLNNVWLGAKSTTEDNSDFVWQGGEAVDYAYWSPDGYPSSEYGHVCVEIDSPVSKAGGHWKNVMCTNANYVLCEMAQSGTGNPPPSNTPAPIDPPSGGNNDLQYLVSSIKRSLDATRFDLSNLVKEVSQLRKDINSAQTDIATIKQNLGNGDLTKRISAMQQDVFLARRDITSTQTEIATLKRNTGVPVGFVYTELPGQSGPKSIWPNYTWTDISSTHAGMFFRVMGGKAGCFGCAQTATSPRVSSVTTSGTKDCGGWSYNNVLTPGTSTKYIRTGGNSGHSIGIKFVISNDEVRPINKAVRLWRRTA